MHDGQELETGAPAGQLASMQEWDTDHPEIKTYRAFKFGIGNNRKIGHYCLWLSIGFIKFLEDLLMGVPLRQQIAVGTYLLKQKLKGVKKYPMVLMLEPLFRCNLACAGCGKIDYPDDVLDQRLSVEQCMEAVDECGAPMVSIPGGEPLIHKEMPQIVAGIIARKKYVYLCTNALLLKKKMDDYTPSPYLTFSIHLDGLKERHDASVCQDGVFDRAVEAIKLAVARGFQGHRKLYPVPGRDARGCCRVSGLCHGVGYRRRNHCAGIQL